MKRDSNAIASHANINRSVYSASESDAIEATALGTAGAVRSMIA